MPGSPPSWARGPPAACARASTRSSPTTWTPGPGRAGFDFAVAEDCEVYDECDAYQRLYGDRVLEVEYADEGSAGFRRACATRGDRWSIVLRDRALRRPGQRGHVLARC